MDNKIQTGLRIPEKLHTALQNKADEIGISINQLILVLINLGLKFYNEGVIPPSDME